MNNNLDLIIEAANQLKMPFRKVNEASHFLEFNFNNKPYFFCWWAHPYSSEVQAEIFKDKNLCHELLEKIVRMPPSKTFYKDRNTTDEIIQDVEKRFGYPMVVKPCKGTLAKDVRFCNKIDELKKAIETIFYDHEKSESNKFEEALLIQSYIDQKKEYRMVYFYGEILLIYHRDYIFDEAGRLKKIKIVIEKDPALEKKLHDFVKPVIDFLNIDYTGFDIFVKNESSGGECYLIELNSYPLFRVMSEYDYDSTIEIFKRMLLTFKSRVEKGLA